MNHSFKTKRLRIAPMEEAALQALIDRETDGHLRAAYAQMRDGAREHPQERLWYTAWQLSLRNGEPVGDICFKGTPRQGEVELGYGILPAHQGQGYATEAVQSLTDWAFAQDGVFAVTAETEPGNAASQRVLSKAGYLPDGEGQEGPRFRKEKPPAHWMAAYLCLGMGVGAGFGAANGDLAISMVIGMGIGMALGASLDAQENSRRARAKAATQHPAQPPQG